MNKRKIIYIHGRPGAGKSSTADNVAKALGYDRMSAGHFFREEAEECGISLLELARAAQSDPSVDIRVDKKQKEYIESRERMVFDGRIGFHLAPGSIFNVFLELDARTAAERILKDMRKNPGRASEKAKPLEEMIKDIDERAKLERRKLKQLYGIENCFDGKHFDLIVDTKKNNLERVTKVVLEKYEKWLSE